jgi:hypothetical protein
LKLSIRLSLRPAGCFALIATAPGCLCARLKHESVSKTDRYRYKATLREIARLRRTQPEKYGPGTSQGMPSSIREPVFPTRRGIPGEGIFAMIFCAAKKIAQPSLRSGDHGSMRRPNVAPGGGCKGIKP